MDIWIDTDKSSAAVSVPPVCVCVCVCVCVSGCVERAVDRLMDMSSAAESVSPVVCVCVCVCVSGCVERAVDGLMDMSSAAESVSPVVCVCVSPSSLPQEDSDYERERTPPSPPPARKLSRRGHSIKLGCIGKQESDENPLMRKVGQPLRLTQSQVNQVHDPPSPAFTCLTCLCRCSKSDRDRDVCLLMS